MSTRKSRSAEVAVVRPSQPRVMYQAVAGATERRLPGALEVPIEQVVADPQQPRRDWDYDDGEQRLSELATSIGEFGVLQPLVVREDGTLPDGRQRYVVVAGGRRRAAAEVAGLKLVPVVVTGQEPSRARVIQLVENLQRQDLSPLDEARAYQELIDLRDVRATDVASLIHVSAQHVRERLRLLADQVLSDAVARRQISATAARDIRKLPDEAMMAFRSRVLAGEHVQSGDVSAERARLTAAGVVNPRRKAARRAVVEPVDPTGSMPAGAESPLLSAEQTTFVPQPVPRSWPGRDEPRPAPPEFDSTIHQRESADEIRKLAAAVTRRLDGETRSLVLELVATAARSGWACATLERLLRDLT